MIFGAVIAAAGMSTRMKDFKQLMKIGDMTFAERVVTNFQRAGVQDIAVVTGYRGGDVEKSLRHTGAAFLQNLNYEHTEMFDSARIGFDFLKDRCESIFFCPVDVPFFQVETVRKEMENAGKADVLVPWCGSRPGHPILLSAAAVRYILAYDGKNGIRGAYEAMKAEDKGTVGYLTVCDDGAAMDADTKEDYRRLMKLHNARLLRPEVRISLCSEKPFFTGRTAALFRQIQTLGSVRDACSKCGFSYSQGWSIIRDCEQQLGYPLVQRRQGGRYGGSAALTQRGTGLLEKYEEFEREMNEESLKKFNEIFAGGEWLKKET